MSGTTHIIGAGLAGLSAAVRLASQGSKVMVHEATAFAGGRCRSYHDASVGMTIDNGNHLLLSGNHAAMDFLDDVGGRDKLIGPAHAEFHFADLKSIAVPDEAVVRRSTGGTSGKPVTVLLDRESEAERMLVNHRMYAMMGRPLGAPTLMIAGSPIDAVAWTTLRDRVK